jgi:hypothetical protein
VGNEVESVEKAVGLRAEVVRILDQDRPVAARKVPQARRGDRAMLHVPLRTMVVHQARDGVARSRDRQHFARRKRIAPARECTADEQRLALPVAAHERCRIDAGGVLA